jgi:hypothetical protein
VKESASGKWILLCALLPRRALKWQLHALDDDPAAAAAAAAADGSGV